MPDRRGEITVGSAAGAALFQAPSPISPRRACLLEQLHARLAAFEWRAIESAADLDMRAGDLRPQCMHRALYAFRIRLRDRTRIDRRARLGGDDIGARAARDHADGQRDAVGGILQIVDGEDLARQLADGADPLPGSRPACADTPRAIISNWPTPLRRS